jgi:hypothetical protein
MGAQTDAANVKKVLANPEPSTLWGREWKWPAVGHQNGPNDPERNSRAGPPVRPLTETTSRRSRYVHRQSELKRGPVKDISRGPQPTTVSFHDRTANR